MPRENTFRENLLAAGIAGVIAALILTFLQIVWITPLILKAETYEDSGAPTPSHEHSHHADVVNTDAVNAEVHDHSTHDHNAHEHSPHENGPHEHTPNEDSLHEHDHGASQDHAVADHHDDAVGGHHHDENEWKPADGLQRTLFTFASDTVMGVGYALLLIGVYSVWRRPVNATQGLLFGLAGFIVFFAAPGIGLPPELPGTKAAELMARQQWWIGTAIATAIGLALLFLQKNWLLRAVGVVVLVAPHIIGAPHPTIEGALAPADLQNHFRIATTISNAAFWLILGTLSASALQKFSSSQSAAQ